MFVLLIQLNPSIFKLSGAWFIHVLNVSLLLVSKGPGNSEQDATITKMSVCTFDSIESYHLQTARAKFIHVIMFHCYWFQRVMGIQNRMQPLLK